MGRCRGRTADGYRPARNRGSRTLHGRHAQRVEAEHGADVVGHRRACSLPHFLGSGYALVVPLLDRPALRQVAVHRVVRGGLVGQQVRLHAALEQFGQHIGDVAQQAHRLRCTGLARFVDQAQRFVQVVGPRIQIAGAQAHVDAALAAFHR
ncbi:hypothetical protein G6F50_016651 [Rhizopus delemar]|uniref:Uncharacterized protein n=1 Tax=Rhizopus delemar TaxID=936053 RepID=A0A9P6XSF3_9FUNG|nr:hypothetical protein G6F50_016651 [Rhizopus delemar]